MCYCMSGFTFRNTVSMVFNSPRDVGVFYKKNEVCSIGSFVKCFNGELLFNKRDFCGLVTCTPSNREIDWSSFSTLIILCGWLGSTHQLTNWLICSRNGSSSGTHLYKKKYRLEVYVSKAKLQGKPLTGYGSYGLFWARRCLNSLSSSSIP